MALFIGTSEVEHVMATQCLPQSKSKTMLVKVDGTLSNFSTAKDIALAIDQKTIDFLEGKEFAPKGAQWNQAVEYWQSLPSDPDAEFDLVIELRAEDIAPQVTWGTSPEQVVPVDKTVPAPSDFDNEGKAIACKSALNYMGLEAGTKMTDIPVDFVFLGSCTNSRIEDFRAAAAVAKGTTVPENVTAIAVPGSYLVKEQAEKEGLDKIFTDAGWEWREPGCSMCLAMNGDQLKPGERCASTSNRNFEGRQGKGGRTHLVSPAMAAATAGAGRFVDIRELEA